VTATGTLRALAEAVLRQNAHRDGSGIQGAKIVATPVSPDARFASPHDASVYVRLATSDITERYRAALFWIVEHLPENWEALKSADAGQGEADPDFLRALMEAGVDAFERRCGAQ
jgi:hypothetical protein